MPTIHYNGTGGATEAEMDDVESKGKNWRDGADRILHHVDKRFDVDAVQIVISWDVADDQVEDSIGTLDTAISNMGAALPLASEVATVDYSE